MKVDKRDLDILKDKVAIRFGNMPRTPTDFNLLAEEIHASTRHRVSASTLKRIWGYVESGYGTSYSSLTTVCRYVGYNDWDSFLLHAANTVKGEETSGFIPGSSIITSTLLVGSLLTLEWADSKSCRIRKIRNPDYFRVEESANIKILPGDEGRIETISSGKTFIFHDILRKKHELGTYTGAVKGGVRRIMIEISD